jgi:hypothetical protein
MLQCKKITEAPGRASFIALFVAVLWPLARQSQQSYRSARTGIAARFANDCTDYGEFASTRRYWSRELFEASLR